MKKVLTFVFLLIACVVLSFTCLACGHEHTFNDTWTYSSEKHWKDANCGHEEKIEEGEHTFDEGKLNSDRTLLVYTCSVCSYAKEEAVNHQYSEGVINEDKTQISYTCSKCGDVKVESHTHTYGEWITDTPATITEKGTRHRVCSLSICGKVQSGTIEKVEIVSLTVKVNPTKMEYRIGEEFDKTGMVVMAVGKDNSTLDITSYMVVEEKPLVLGENEIIIKYVSGENTYRTSVTITMKGDSITYARKEAKVNEQLFVAGYFVGVSQDGPTSAKELLIKDQESDDIISVREVNYSTFENNFGYKYGDLIQLKTTVKEETLTNLATKRYLQFSSENPTNVSDSIVSRNNQIEYTFDDAVQLPSYREWSANVKRTATPYTYLHITGIFYTSKLSANNEIVAMVTADTTAQVWGDLKIDKRLVTLRDNVMKQNLGEDWLEFFGGDLINFNADGAYIKQGYMKQVDIYAVYVGGTSSYAQLNVLSNDWLNDKPVKEVSELTAQDKIREVALSYYRQGNQIQYNQTMSRRNIDATPESATAQHLTYLDCSSFANAVMKEAIGINIIPDQAVTDGFVTSTMARTADIATYARYNKTNPDVIRYYVKSETNTEEKTEAVRNDILSVLQVGDLINYRTGTGHIMLYIGDDLWIHCRGGDYYDDDLTSASTAFDQAWAYEKTEGTIGFLHTYDLFYNTSSSRYLLGGKKTNLALLRPVARLDAKVTEKTETRMQNRGLEMEKTLDAGTNSSVQKGEEITYTITLRNHALVDYKGIVVREVLDSNVTLVSAPTGYTLENGVLTFTMDAPKYKEVTASYTVKVKQQTPAGTIIRSEQTTIAGISQAKIINTVAGLTTTELSSVATKAIQYASENKTFANAMDFVETLYSEAVGVSLPDYTTVGSALDDILDIENLSLKNTAIANMVVPNIYGGRSMAALYLQDVENIRMIEKWHLSVGDIIIAEFDKREKGDDAWVKTGVIEYVIYVYVGGDQLVAYTNEATFVEKANTCTLLTMGDRRYDKEHILVTLFNYDRYAVIRPSIMEK